jgi:hypothetical protein
LTKRDNLNKNKKLSRNNSKNNAVFVTADKYIGCSFKFPVKVGVEESIVKALRITDHGSASCLTVVCVFTPMVRSQSTLQHQL